MTTPHSRHRRARAGAVVARAAVVVGLAAAIGLLMAGSDPATEWVASAACPASAAIAPFAAL